MQKTEKIYYPSNYKKRTKKEFNENVLMFHPQEIETARLISIILKDNNYEFNNDKYYDILFIKKNLRIEVKTVRKMNITGNCFIETSYKYKPNGIYDTKANYFCINNNNDKLKN